MEFSNTSPEPMKQYLDPMIESNGCKHDLKFHVEKRTGMFGGEDYFSYLICQKCDKSFVC